MAKKSKNRSMMRRDFDNTFVEQFADGAARAAFVSSWADYQEERGKTYPGEDLMDVAPSTPLSAYVWAGELIGNLENANRDPICTIGARAAKADGVDWEDFEGTDFGHYLAMQALGHGVSWFDDHARFKLKVPHMEYNWFGPGS
jgi:hypothetical protein